jgi:hypothetical protein
VPIKGNSEVEVNEEMLGESRSFVGGQAARILRCM